MHVEIVTVWVRPAFEIIPAIVPFKFGALADTIVAHHATDVAGMSCNIECTFKPNLVCEKTLELCHD